MTLIETVSTVTAIVASITSILINLWALYTMRLMIGKTLAKDARALVQHVRDEYIPPTPVKETP